MVTDTGVRSDFIRFRTSPLIMIGEENPGVSLVHGGGDPQPGGTRRHGRQDIDARQAARIARRAVQVRAYQESVERFQESVALFQRSMARRAGSRARELRRAATVAGIPDRPNVGAASPPATEPADAPRPRRMSRVPANGRSGHLTRRQREVAALIAHGRTNRQIADELVLTTGTVANHVEHILSRLGFDSRTQVAVWAIQSGLVPPGGIKAPEV
jgi:DNA-binding NarL/FixJ family response regulator